LPAQADAGQADAGQAAGTVDMRGEARSSELQGWLEGLRAGDPTARDRLIERAQERLHCLARRMLKGFPGVARWEDSDDVTQNAMVKLWRALSEVAPRSVREFLALAATQTRRVLIDLARHHYGPQGAGRRHRSPPPDAVGHAEPGDSSYDPRRLAAWEAFHTQIEGLPDAEREVFELHWYEGLTHAEAAALLEVSVDTIKRRWQSARLRLYDALRGDLPT
jgi:RNA polymerase sigma-70 factor (ECF subfamily)